MSAKGLAMPLESREDKRARGLVLFQKKHFRSDSMLCTTSDPVLDFRAEFAITSISLL